MYRGIADSSNYTDDDMVRVCMKARGLSWVR
jgi:hypothetical protein